MSEPIIEIRDVGKKYNIYHQSERYLALRDLMTQFFTSPLKTIKEKKTREEFWALRNISVDIARGETVGIIGANGAGKSTLLKILSKITPPTEGEIIIRGKVASLLEVGTGFHLELTGRENIYLNGAILGMSKNEIKKKFDSIVEFSGIEKFLDTPVKRYSSGMYVRLAFSIAAHLEPDILIVDEVLAVGDSEFQKKCLGRMEQVTSAEGRTILFVSHNMATVQRICSRCILLEKGRIKDVGETNYIVQKYSESRERDGGLLNPRHRPAETIINSKGPKVKKITLSDTDGQIRNEFSADEMIRFHCNIDPDVDNTEDYSLVWFMSNFSSQLIAVGASTPIDNIKFSPDTKNIYCDINPRSLLPGSYYLRVALHVPNVVNFDDWNDAITFKISRNDEHKTGYNYPGIWTMVQQYLPHKFK
jgi:lipopolysaccharide transport system ATP-binding protein